MEEKERGILQKYCIENEWNGSSKMLVQGEEGGWFYALVSKCREKKETDHKLQIRRKVISWLEQLGDFERETKVKTPTVDICQ